MGGIVDVKDRYSSSEKQRKHEEKKMNRTIRRLSNTAKEESGDVVVGKSRVKKLLTTTTTTTKKKKKTSSATVSSVLSKTIFGNNNYVIKTKTGMKRKVSGSFLTLILEMTMQSLSQRKMLDKDTNSAREESAKRILEQKFNWRIKLDKRMKEKESTTNNKDNKKSKESNGGSKETKTSDETEPITKKKLPPPQRNLGLGVHTPVDPGSMPYPSSPPPPPPQSTRTKEEADPNKDATSSEHSPAISSLTHSFHEASLTTKKELPPFPDRKSVV